MPGLAKPRRGWPAWVSDDRRICSFMVNYAGRRFIRGDESRPGRRDRPESMDGRTAPEAPGQPQHK